MRRLALALIFGAGLVLAAPAGAATFTVDSADDEADLSINGTCDSAPGSGVECTLRAAVQEANDTVAPDTINLPALEDTDYQLDLGGPGEDEAAGGDLDVVEPLTLLGLGQPVIDALGSDRVLHIGPEGGPAVTVSGVELRGGDGVALGGGVLVEDGTLAMQSSTVAGNRAASPGDAAGGGIWFGSVGAHSISASTISGNLAEGGTGADGGGLVVDGPGVSVSLTNVTVSGNEATASGGVARGGGIASAGPISLLHTTLHQNSATGDGGLGGSIMLTAGLTTLRASIVSGGTGVAGAENCFESGGGFSSSGGNFEAPSVPSATQCGLSPGAGDHFGGSGELAPLADRGGPTQTHALLTTSAALDGVPFCFPLANDQRGEPRPSGSACDGGAFERQVLAPQGTACFGNTPTIIGTVESETLVGTPGDDVIIGQAGNDVIKGLEGADLICAGKGGDRALAGAGDDLVAGEDGRDRLFGQAGRDLLLGNAARDLLSGGKGRDTLNGGGHHDRCKGARKDRAKRC